MMEGKREGRREKPTKIDGMLLISGLGVRMVKEWSSGGRRSAYGQRKKEQSPRVDSERVDDHAGAMKAPGPNMRT